MICFLFYNVFTLRSLYSTFVALKLTHDQEPKEHIQELVQTPTHKCFHVAYAIFLVNYVIRFEV